MVSKRKTKNKATLFCKVASNYDKKQSFYASKRIGASNKPFNVCKN